MCNRESCGGCQSGCQQSELQDFSRLSRPFPVVALQRAWWRIGNSGLRPTLRYALAHVRNLRKTKPKSEFRGGFVEILGLQPGEWVEVKSYAEICHTLDSRGSTRGLKFLPGMLPFCGGRFRVHKRLETLFLEESRQIRKMKNTVLLEAVYCDGSTYRCDRSCFYYWREAWLRKASAPAGERRNSFVEVSS